jgi:hypothetical protein
VAYLLEERKLKNGEKVNEVKSPIVKNKPLPSNLAEFDKSLTEDEEWD